MAMRRFQRLMAGGWRALAALAVGLFVVCGCASRDNLELSRLLDQLGGPPPEQAVQPRAGDAPEAPVSALPPLSPGMAQDIQTGSLTIQPDCLVQINIEDGFNLPY